MHGARMGGARGPHGSLAHRLKPWASLHGSAADTPHPIPPPQVQLVRLGAGITAEGVRALASAPAMASIQVAGCPGVRPAACRQHRAGVRVRVDDLEV